MQVQSQTDKTLVQPPRRDLITGEGAWGLGGSEAADVGEALELLWEVVLVEDGVGAVLHHLQRHRAEHRCKLVDAFRSVGDVQKKRVHGDHFIFWGKVISVLSVKPLNPSGPSGQIHVFGRLDQYYVLCKVTLGALKGASKLNYLLLLIQKTGALPK